MMSSVHLHMRAPLARNIAVVIDDLYRQHAPPRNHERLIELVQHHVERAMWLAIKDERRGRGLADGEER